MILIVGVEGEEGVPSRECLSSTSEVTSRVHDILGSVNSLIGEIPRSWLMVLWGERGAGEGECHLSESPEVCSRSSSDKGAASKNGSNLGRLTVSCTLETSTNTQQ